MFMRHIFALTIVLAPAPALLAQDSSAPVPNASAPVRSQLNVDSPIGEILDNPAARAILTAHLPALVNAPQIDSARGISLRQLAHYQPAMLTPQILTAIGAELARNPAAVGSNKAVAPPRPLDPRLALSPQSVRLWERRAPGATGDRWEDVPTLTAFTPGEAVNTGAAVIVAPGGGYQMLAASLEGRQVADWFAARGVTAFVLTYRLATSGYAHPTQLMDAKRAIRWVRANAATFGVRPDRIGMIGFSAGGHLAAMAETQFDPGDARSADPVERVSSRPDFAILGYPAITLSSGNAKGLGLVSAKTPKEALDQLNPIANIRPDTPPTFLWATTTDELVPATDSTAMYNALVAAKVPAELHIFGHGRHGMALGMADPAISLWTTTLQNWLIYLGIIGAKEAPKP
jgi:acetyl esterase/lipase